MPGVVMHKKFAASFSSVIAANQVDNMIPVILRFIAVMKSKIHSKHRLGSGHSDFPIQ